MKNFKGLKRALFLFKNSIYNSLIEISYKHMNIKKLLEGKWSDKYFCKLALFDHIRECLEKDNHLKATDEPKDSEKYKDLEKELMDLNIILDLYFHNREELKEERLRKFLNKMETLDK